MKDNPFDPRERQRRFGGPDLTGRILDRTTGRACGRAEDLLAGRWDGAAEPVDGALLHEHLERCPACRALATVLDRLPPLLRQLAEREPGPAFTARVLAATSGRRSAAVPVAASVAASVQPSAGRPLTALERAAQRLQERLRRAWERPRFALEAAWTAAALASLLVWSPLAPEGVPVQVERAVQAGAGIVPELVVRAEQFGRQAIAAGFDLAGPTAKKAEARLNEIRRLWAVLLTALRNQAEERGESTKDRPR